jgi:hypothetical protein
MTPSTRVFGKKVLLFIYHLEGSCVEVTGLEKKTQDISRSFLHFGRGNRQTCVFSLYVWIQAFVEVIDQRIFEQI